MACTTTREERAERWRFFNVVAATVLATFDVAVRGHRPGNGPGGQSPRQEADSRPPPRRPKPAPADETRKPTSSTPNGLPSITPRRPAAATAATAASAADLSAAPTSPSACARTRSGESLAVKLRCRTTAGSARPLPDGEEERKSACRARRQPPAPAPAGGRPRFGGPGQGQQHGRLQHPSRRLEPCHLQGSRPGLFRLRTGRRQGRDGQGPHRRRHHRACSSPASATARPSSPTGGSRRSTSPRAGSTTTASRLGGTVLAEPKPDSRISSPFGTRRYYGRSTGTASTTASTSRARSASRSMPPPTA